MGNLIFYIFYFAVILTVALGIIQIIFDIIQNKKIYLKSWRSMIKIKRNSLIAGLVAIVFMPILEGHPGLNHYLSKVIYIIFTELGKGLFIVGMLAFLEQVHKEFEEERRRMSE